jgi:hypothetical protein
MKRTIQSLLMAGALALALTGCTTTGSHSATWEYRVVEGWLDNTTHGGATFVEHINKAAADGWEVVSVSASGGNGRPFAVVRRQKR